MRRRAGATIATALAFVLATALAVVLHLDLPVTRRVVAARVNALLATTFAGDARIEHIGHLSLGGISGGRGRVVDPDGVTVLFVDGVRAEVDALAIARSALLGAGDIVVAIDTLRVEHAEVAVDAGRDGDLRLVNAFELKSVAEHAGHDPGARASREVRLEGGALRLGHAWVHGQPPGAPRVDAEVAHLEGSGLIGPEVTRAEVARVDLLARGLPRGVDPRGVLSGRVRAPSITGTAVAVDASFGGAVAGVATNAHASLDGESLDVVIDARDPANRRVPTPIGELAVDRRATLHAEAHGQLSRLAAQAMIALGDGGSIAVDASLARGPTPVDGTRVEATVGMRHLDLQALFPSAPRSDLGLDASGTAVMAQSGALSGELSLETLPGRLAGEALPVLRARAAMADGRARATGRVDDPRASAAFQIDVGKPSADAADAADAAHAAHGAQRASAGLPVEARVRAEVKELAALPGLGARGANVSGRAAVTADLRTRLAPGRKATPLDAHVAARGTGLAYGAHRAGDVRVVARATGTLAAPIVDLGIHSGAVRWGEVAVDAVDVRARVEPGKVLAIREPHVDIVKDAHVISASASHVEIGGPRVLVHDASLAGLGDPIRGRIAHDARQTHIAIDAPAIDLARVAALAGRPSALREGRLAVRADVALTATGADGEVHAEVASLSTAAFAGASGSFSASFAGPAIAVEAHGELAEAGRFDLATAGVVLGGTATDPRAWRDAWGRARFAATLDMAKLESLLPVSVHPATEIEGQLTVAATLRRDGPDVPPEMSVHAHTRGLVVSSPTALRPPARAAVAGRRVDRIPRWRSAGVDVAMEARVDATSGAAAAAFRAFDAMGNLVAFDAKADLPYQEIFAHPASAAARLAASPLRAKLVVPKRALADYPALARTAGIAGTFEAELDVSGTAREPRAALIAHARGIHADALPVAGASDVDVRLAYDGTSATLDGVVRSDRRTVATIGSHVEVRAADLARALEAPLDWTARARVALDGFPLDTAGTTPRDRIRARISGTAALEDLHRDAKVSARLGLEDVSVGNAAYPRGGVALEAGNGNVAARARLEQSDGYAELAACVAMRWGAALVPAIDPNGAADARIEARAFRVAAALPALRTIFEQLDGRIDADATVTRGAGGASATIAGRAALREGTVQLVGVGPLFKEVRAVAAAQPDGTLRIADGYARAGPGELTARGTMTLRGLAFDSATASVSIPAKKAIELSLQGQPLGELHGEIEMQARAAPGGDHIAMKVDVPDAHFTVPRTAKSGIQELGSADNIHVGMRRGPRRFVELPLDHEDIAGRPRSGADEGTRVEIDVHVARLEVIYGRMARMVLQGDPHVSLGGATRVSGNVEVRWGRIEVQGKEFEVDKATITFRPDQEPSNPVVVATASWAAPDGTKVHADFAGAVETGKVNLRSEPALPKNQILALILFGVSDGMNAPSRATARGTGAAARAAVGIGGGLAAEGITQALDDLTGIQARARIDTSRANNPAPEIEFQIARRISLEFQHVLGTPPLSRPDKNLVTVEWRFARKWALETTVGDRGTLQSDATWQKHY